MNYFSQSRLMLESEQAITEHAHAGPLVTQRVCVQLLSEPTRYVRWHVRHEQRMGAVAHAKVRQRQILALRAFALEQIHGSALVRYLRDYRVVGAIRDRTLHHFFGVADSRDAALMAHRDYILAASSQVCAADLLELANDSYGVELLGDYEQAYGQFFSMFCESERGKQDGEPYLLASLLPRSALGREQPTAADTRGRLAAAAQSRGATPAAAPRAVGPIARARAAAAAGVASVRATHASWRALGLALSSRLGPRAESMRRTLRISGRRVSRGGRASAVAAAAA